MTRIRTPILSLYGLEASAKRKTLKVKANAERHNITAMVIVSGAAKARAFPHGAVQESHPHTITGLLG